MTTQSATAAPQSPGIWSQIHRWIRWLKIICHAVVILFVVLLLAEAVRLYQVAASVHPFLGYASILLMAAVSLLVVIPAYRFFEVPRAVKPPAIPAPSDLRVVHLRAEVRFLERYLANCARNPEFEERRDEIARARDELGEMAARFRGAGEGQVEELSQELHRWTEKSMVSILGDVDRKAEQVIYQEALNVGLATAASPNGTLDAFVMLWRSVNLSSKLAVLYYGRPGVWGTLAILRDVSIATATAAYLHKVSDSLGKVVARTIGGIAGLVAGPAVEGVTNALVLIRIGYLTQERCRSFRKWDTRARKSALIAALNATQKVALGLSTEIVRQVGSGLGMVAGVAASGISHAAEAAGRGIATATGSALNAAADLGQRITSVFRTKKDSEAGEAVEETEKESGS